MKYGMRLVTRIQLIDGDGIILAEREQGHGDISPLPYIELYNEYLAIVKERDKQLELPL